MAYSLAVCSAFMVSLHGMKIEALEKVSIIVSIVSYKSETGSLTMKSMAIDVKGVEYVSDGMGYGEGLGWFGWFFFA